MKIYFVINIFEKLNLCEYWIHVFSTDENGALILYFKKIFFLKS